jgi:hypothetical protein
VQDAHYFRSQAELYRELALRMSVRSDSEYCRIQAAHCLARAIELETEPQRAAAA